MSLSLRKFQKNLLQRVLSVDIFCRVALLQNTMPQNSKSTFLHIVVVLNAKTDCRLMQRKIVACPALDFTCLKELYNLFYFSDRTSRNKFDLLDSFLANSSVRNWIGVLV